MGPAYCLSIIQVHCQFLPLKFSENTKCDVNLDSVWHKNLWIWKGRKNSTDFSGLFGKAEVTHFLSTLFRLTIHLELQYCLYKRSESPDLPSIKWGERSGERIHFSWRTMSIRMNILKKNFIFFSKSDFKECASECRKLLNLYELKQTKQNRFSIQKAEDKFHSYCVFEVSSISVIFSERSLWCTVQNLP